MDSPSIVNLLDNDEMRDKFDEMYMGIAKSIAQQSYCKRAQVGCIAVKNDNIVSFGYNGTLRGHKNECEEVVIGPNGVTERKTRSDVLHAEQNLICKAARDGVSLKDATLYITMMPCATCANLLVQSGFKRIVVMDNYRSDLGYRTLTSSLNKEPILVDFIEDILHAR